MRILLAATLLFSVACKKKTEELAEPTVKTELGFVEPKLGAWSTANSIEAFGTALNVGSIEVNGQPAVTEGDQWSAQLPLVSGMNLFELSGVTDKGAHFFERRAVLAGNFEEANGPVAHAMSFRVNKSGLDGVSDVINEFMDPVVIEEAMAAVNPVYSDAYGVFGLDAVTVEADVGSLDFQPMQINLTPRNGVLEIEMAMPNLLVGVPVRGSIIGIDFDVDAELGASAVVLTGAVSLGVGSNGKLDISIINSQIELQGFWFDTSLIPGSIVADLLVGTVRGVVEDTLNEQMDLLLPVVLEDYLSAFELAADFEILSTPMSIGMEFEQAGIDNEGIYVNAGVDVRVSDATPGLGYLHENAPPPNMDKAAGISIAMSDNILNRVAYEAWAADMLTMRLSSDDGTLEPILLHSLGAKTEATITTKALLPPVVIEREGLFLLQLGELDVEILTPGGSNGERLLISVSGEVPLDAEVQQGAFNMTLGDPLLALMVRDNDWHVTNDTITELLEQELPLDLLLALAGDFSFPLPALGGFTLDEALIDRDGTGSYTRIRTSL